MDNAPVAPVEQHLIPVVQVRDLTKTYGAGLSRVDALAGVNLDIYAGQFTAIMGPSGSGKSTLLHIVAGLDRPTGGQIMVAGTDLSTLRDATIFRRDKIGFIFQAFNLIPTLDGRDNILLPAKLAKRRIDPDWFDIIVDALGLRDRLHHRPYEMSGGQQQRIAIARALVSKPALIVADEPTGNLDSQTSADVLALLRQAVDHFQQTVLMVTHDPRAAAQADRVLVVRDGLINGDLFSPTADQLAQVV